MYLLYVDESGAPDTDHFVVGGVAIHEQDAWVLSRRVDRLLESVPYPAYGSELHADHIRGGKKVWRGVTKDIRAQLNRDVATLLTTFQGGEGRRARLFTAVIHKPSFPYVDPYERAYEDFFARCNGFLGRLASQGDRHRCVAISDKSRLESALQNLMRG